jgi:hypothetical protein
VIRADQVRTYRRAMSDAHIWPRRPSEAGLYEIRLTGHLDARWSSWFDGLAVTPQDDGGTLVRGPVIDQAALHGRLQKVRDTGLPLVSVTRVDAARAPTDR